MHFFQCFILLIILLIIPSSISVTLDAITPDQPLKDGDVLFSISEIYALGFFSPGNSRSRYVGLWFNKVPTKTIVWVANRNNPIIPVSERDGNKTGTGGSLEINSNGGLIIYGEDRIVPVWSSNVTASSRNSSLTAKLWDTGNFVLLENIGGRENVLWQGFDYPTNTFLPFMKLGVNRRSGLNWFCTSWKSEDDPGNGNYSVWMDPRGNPQLFLSQDQTPQWRLGSWTGLRWSGSPRWSGTPILTTTGIFNISFVNDENEISTVFGVTNSSIFAWFELVVSGIIERPTWHDDVGEWGKLWTSPVEPCDRYGHCGLNSNCDPTGVDAFECTCLPGFEPKLPENWNLKDGSGGCVRKVGLSMCGNREGFVKVVRVKLPESSTARVNMSLGLKECEQECLRNCSCMAFSNADERWGGVGCVTWHEDLMDTKTYSNSGQDLYVRVDSIVLAQYAKSNGSLSMKAKVAIVLVSVLVFILGVPLLLWLVIRRKRKGKQSKNVHFSKVTGRSTYFEDCTADDLDDESKVNSNLPFYDLATIAAATDNFSVANQLGKGGFGSVYKGVLGNGKEIAVKRLSKDSGQGIEEFKNEVVLIAKLQHRNLVRILGCCVQDEEKMLIYEYLPNKSLDSFIFNEETRSLLDWTRRFEIICGIARGILYLHQDSRLRIIHRDLKSSNVLLDASMTPKIADFGMARIFKADQNEANTNRVVGTYGYMSPEYAMRGLFSVKSDVYSFGILLLEIITGRKNNAHYHEERQHPDLVVNVWNLWTEGNALEIVDSTLGETYPINEILRCFQIALLCVQEYATDRPTMSAVVFMLGNDTAVPSPKQPAFSVKGTYNGGDPSTGTEGTNYSVNDVACTTVEPR